ncbi:nuclear valosin-containing protein-like isoform X2 [Chelonus insularis]|nr:nuclear valosin-containing protein-like isoform X2 [Chelonus insularis]
MITTMGRSNEDHQPRIQGDSTIISRVQTYLCENEDKVYIDVNEMADSLQRKYRDYRQKKRGPFRALVRRAYDEITESFSKKSDSLSRQDDYDDEVEIESDTPVNDPLGKELLKMYTKSSERNGNSSDKELIDISSDDDSEKLEDIAPEKIARSSHVSGGPSSKIPPKPSAHSCQQKYAKADVDITKLTPNTPKMLDARNKTILENSRKRPREKSSEDFPTSKKKKESHKAIDVKVKFADVGGNKKVLEDVCRLLVHIKHPEIFKQIGISPPRGFLLHGPPGCGKSLMAHAIAGELNVPLIKVAAPELIGGVSGESESRIRELFDKAVACAPCVLFLDEIDAMAPHRATAQREMERRMVAQLLSCLDELSFKENGEQVLVLGATNRPDAMDPALRRAGRFDREVCLGIPDKESRECILQVHTARLSLAKDIDLKKIAAMTPGFVGADLVALLREAAIAAVDRIFKKINNEKKLNNDDKKISEPVAEIIENEKEKESDVSEKATDREINEMDTTATEKKDEEPSIVVSDEVSVEQTIISPVVQNDDQSLPVTDENSTKVPESSEKLQNNFEDLDNLLKLLRDKNPLSPERLSDLHIENVDFDIAFRVVQPSSKREGFATVPDVTWEDIGSLQEIREELQMAILAPVKHSESFAAFGLTTPTGVLLCGPPGCGKTLLAKAIANEAEINFISVKGPELLNMYVGESEKAVRQCFIRARNSAPCVIFFDEFDALCPKRTEGDNSSTSRVVNQILTEMDGIEGRKGVYLMAATNRPDIIDPAVLRPGRFDKILYVGLPTPLDRVDILKALTKNGTRPKLAADVDLEIIAKSDRCDGYSGADLASLIREAGIQALKESMINNSGLTEVYMRHIDTAFTKVRPSILDKDAKHYEKLRKLYTIEKLTEVTPMETPIDLPIDQPIIDAPMEEMET